MDQLICVMIGALLYYVARRLMFGGGNWLATVGLLSSLLVLPVTGHAATAQLMFMVNNQGAGENPGLYAATSTYIELPSPVVSQYMMPGSEGVGFGQSSSVLVGYVLFVDYGEYMLAAFDLVSCSRTGWGSIPANNPYLLQLTGASTKRVTVKLTWDDDGAARLHWKIDGTEVTVWCYGRSSGAGAMTAGTVGSGGTNMVPIGYGETGYTPNALFAGGAGIRLAVGESPNLAPTTQISEDDSGEDFSDAPATKPSVDEDAAEHFTGIWQDAKEKFAATTRPSFLPDPASIVVATTENQALTYLQEVFTHFGLGTLTYETDWKIGGQDGIAVFNSRDFITMPITQIQKAKDFVGPQIQAFVYFFTSLYLVLSTARHVMHRLAWAYGMRNPEGIHEV